MRSRIAPLALAVCAAACSSSSSAQSADDPIVAQMAQLRGRLRTRGYTEVGQPAREFLIEHQPSPRSIALRSGTCYTIVAVASRAARDLDLLFFDATGAEVARDASTGPHAVVEYCPPASGAYYRVTKMASGNGIVLSAVYSSPPGVGGSLDDLFAPLESAAPRP